MDNDDRKALKFSGFTLDPTDRSLVRRGRRLDLNGKPFDLLALLVRRAPALVTREEIRAALWPGRVIEYDAAINAGVRAIRHALADDPKQPRFVETVPRHGYRFLGTVTPVEARSARFRPRLATTVVATLIVCGIGVAILSSTEDTAPTPLPTAAREAFVKGEHLLATHDPQDAARAIPLFEQAVAADPGNAKAWSALSDARYKQYGDPRKTMPGALAAVNRSLALAPELARAQRRLADIRFVWHWQFDAAETAYRRALDTDAGDAETHHAYAAFLMAMNRESEAFAHMRRALAIDPLSLVLHGDLAWFHAMVGRHERALEECKLLLELAPDNRRAIACPLRSLITLGRLEAAAAVASRLAPDAVGIDGSAAGRLERYWQWQLERQQAALAEDRFVEPVALALTLARLGDPARAIEWIERARDERSRLVVYLWLFPEFRALHAHPRFVNAALPAARGKTALEIAQRR